MSTTRYATMSDRLAANVVVYAPTGCFDWQGNVGNSGYARLAVRCCGKVIKLYAHRVSVELATGQAIPAGLEVDHTCYNTTCINPEHLELVTPEVNKARRSSAAAKAAKAIQKARRSSALVAVAVAA